MSWWERLKEFLSWDGSEQNRIDGLQMLVDEQKKHIEWQEKEIARLFAKLLEPKPMIDNSVNAVWMTSEQMEGMMTEEVSRLYTRLEQKNKIIEDLENRNIELKYDLNYADAKIVALNHVIRELKQ